ncbi:MAG: pentapeptide repeat-containing protein [Spirochaetales bacterium]
MRRTCEKDQCSELAVLDSDLCAIHCEPQHSRLVSDFFARRSEIERVAFDGMTVYDVVFSSKDLHTCSLSNTRMVRCHFVDTVIDLSFLNHSEFIECLFERVRIRSSVFACSFLRDCRFSESTLVQVNFNAATMGKSVFSSSDLLDCRFIAASLSDTDFSDCNMKGSDFTNSSRMNVRYPYCNVFQSKGILGSDKYASIRIPSAELS